MKNDIDDPIIQKAREICKLHEFNHAFDNVPPNAELVALVDRIYQGGDHTDREFMEALSRGYHLTMFTQDENGVTIPSQEARQRAERADWGLREAYKFADKLAAPSCNWSPGDDFVIRIDDKTCDDRTSGQLEQMVKEIKAVVNKYDFDLSCWGGINNMMLAMHEEYLLRQKYADV